MKVVKVFEYISEEELKQYQPQPANSANTNSQSAQ
jgi:hypothetical protein